MRRLHCLSIEKMAATKIQAAIRSWLVRCWLRIWKRKRAYYIVFCQAHLRRRIIHRQWTNRKKFEFHSATTIQYLIRIFLAKCQLEKRQRENAATIICSNYRIYKARQICNLIVLSNNATLIQTHVRIFLNGIYFGKIKMVKVEAARDIQRCWKGYLARKLSSVLLRDRCTASYWSQIRMLGSEVEFLKSKIDNDMVEKGVYLSNGSTEECDSSIIETARQLEETKKSLAQLTPRAVQQGWKEQLEQDAKSQRALLTNKKMNAVFTIYKDIALGKERVEHEMQCKDKIVKKIDTIQKWKDELHSSLQKENRESQRRESIHKSRLAIAFEKRKWLVRHNVACGKPFKDRNNLMKNIVDGSREQKLMDLLQMQTHFTQLSQMQKLLKPLKKLNDVW